MVAVAGEELFEERPHIVVMVAVVQQQAEARRARPVFALACEQDRNLLREAIMRPAFAAAFPIDQVEIAVDLAKRRPLARPAAAKAGDAPEAELRQQRRVMRRNPVPGRDEDGKASRQKGSKTISWQAWDPANRPQRGG